jgi:phenylpropionate dioxygenase-like ring-hydroxylating dioxygenase large terminal subunit
VLQSFSRTAVRVSSYKLKNAALTVTDISVHSFCIHAHVQMVIDLPYDHSYLVENLLDPAHIPISHHATEGGGDKKNAKPLHFDIDTASIRTQGFNATIQNFGKKPSQYSFEAPCIIRVRSEAVNEKTGKAGLVFGAALHCMPLGQGKSRLLFMTYARRMPGAIKLIASLKPMWLRNLNSCKVLEQDVGMICSQEVCPANTVIKVHSVTYTSCKVCCHCTLMPSILRAHYSTSLLAHRELMYIVVHTAT